MSDTLVRRIDIAASIDLEADIKHQCDGLLPFGYRLAAAFESHNQLIMIFQN